MKTRLLIIIGISIVTAISLSYYAIYDSSTVLNISETDYFEILILPNTIEQRKNFVVYYSSNTDIIFHFDNQDTISYKIDGTSDNEKYSFTLLIDAQSDWFMDDGPSNAFEGVEYIELSASNSETGEVYDWMIPVSGLLRRRRMVPSARAS